jgi:cobalt-zinc-cadmium efflux system outer membrane protein
VAFLPAVVSAAIGVLVAMPASAQTLTWEETLRRAREHAPVAVAAGQSVRAARADAAGAGRWPRTNPVVRLGGEYELDTDPSRGYAVGVEQQFDLAGVASASSRQAAAHAHAARTFAEVETLDALRQAAEAFIDLDLAQRAFATWTGLATLYERLLEATRRTEAAGVTPRQQTLLATIEQGAVTSELAAATAEIARARSALAVLVGLDDPAGLAATSPDDLPPPDDRTEEAMMAFAVEHRPEFPALRARLDEARRRATVARRSLIPAPTLYFGVRGERSVIDAREVRPNAAGQVESTGADHRSILLAADVSFALPVFDRAQAARARADVDALTEQENLSIEARRVRAELGAARASVAATGGSYERWRAIGAALDEATALAQRGYESGQVGILESVVTLERIARGRIAQIRSRAEYWRARMALGRALGVIR